MEISQPGGDIEIGLPVLGGTPDEVLYIDGLGNLAQSHCLTFDDTTELLGVCRQLQFNAMPQNLSDFVLDPVTNFYSSIFLNGTLNFDVPGGPIYSVITASTHVISSQEVGAVNLYADFQRVTNVPGSAMTSIGSYVSYYGHPVLTADTDSLSGGYMLANAVGWQFAEANGGSWTLPFLVDYFSGYGSSFPYASIGVRSHFYALGDSSSNVTTEVGFYGQTMKDYGVYLTASPNYAFYSDAGKNHLWGALELAYHALTTDTVLNGTQKGVSVACSTVNITITLPSAATCAGRVYDISKADATAYVVNVVPNGTDTIAGQTLWIISNQWDSMCIQSTGAGWDFR